MLYSPLWPVWLYGIIPNYLINGMIFGKTFFNLKCVLNFFKTCVWSISHSTKNSARYITIQQYILQYSKIYYNTARYITIQQDILQYSKPYYNTARYITIQQDILQYSKIYYNTARYITIRQDILQYGKIYYNTARYITINVLNSSSEVPVVILVNS
jgi:hypothetical protein